MPNEFLDHTVPRFDDVYIVFILLTDNIQGSFKCLMHFCKSIKITFLEARELLKIKPVYRKQQDSFDRILKCITHLIYLLLATAKTEQDISLV